MRISAVKAITPTAKSSSGRIVRRVSNAVKNEAKLIKGAIKNKDYKSILKVKNPIHGTVKYGALGFLIPIPGMQIVGMLFGAIAGLVPKARQLVSVASKNRFGR